MPLGKPKIIRSLKNETAIDTRCCPYCSRFERTRGRPGQHKEKCYGVSLASIKTIVQLVGYYLRRHINC